MTVFVGVDLAWGPRGFTGICVASADGVVPVSALVRSDEDILAVLRPLTAGPCVVAIDAPLIVRNATGSRPCDRMITRCFGRHHAGAHSANLTLPSFRSGVRAERIAAALGLDVDPDFEPRAEVRRAIEVYPHPAIVSLFALDRILRYKAKRKRPIDERRDAFRLLIEHLESLRASDPAFDVRSSPRWDHLRNAAAEATTQAALDRAEDEIDAYVCAYVGLSYWTHGTERCRVVGDLDSGYIVTPVTEELARCLDAASIGAPAMGPLVQVSDVSDVSDAPRHRLRPPDARRSRLEE